MTRRIIADCKRTVLAALAVGGTLAVMAAGPQASAQGLTYVDADDLAGNFGPLAAVNSGAAVADDLLWGYRAFGANNTLFESGITEDSPTLNQTLTGLTPGKSYDLYGVFWTDKDENWTMQAGTSAGNLMLSSWRGGSLAGAGVPGAQAGITAGAAVWSVVPPPTSEGTIFTQRPADPLVMLLAKAGTATANGAGNLDVFIDDRSVTGGTGGGTRTWFDGVAYVDAGTAIALTASIDRANGALTISNPTSETFHIKAITLDSPAGALSVDNWTPVSGRLDGNGNMSFDPHPWNIIPPATTPLATQLAEEEDAAGGGSGGALTSGGGSISLGNVWVRSPFEDVRLSLTLSDDRLVLMSPTFSGDAVVRGDFDFNGAIDLADFEILRANLHTNTTGQTPAGAYTSGDITGDGAVNFNDFVAFRTAYDNANGVGSFAQIAAAVPEPAGGALLLVGAAALVRQARRRRLSVAVAALVCAVAASGAQAQTLLKIDVDARAGDSTAGPDGDNTVPGFSSFTMDPGLTGVLDGATGNINGYDISIVAVNGAGEPQLGIDDRDRATPTTAPTLNQLYDDFIFVATGAGEGGGVDVTIQGGALQPNTPYTFSLYSFDTGSTGTTRTANWLDGNRQDVLSFTTSFIGTASPTADDQYKFNGIALADESGRLFLKGRNTTPLTADGGVNPGVFLNGIELSPFTGLILEVNVTSGALSIRNEHTAPIDLSYYEIRSNAGSLNPAGWNSLDDGEGGDPVGTGWDEAGGSSANILSEVNLTSLLSLAASGGSANLGLGFAAGGTQDLSFLYAAPGETSLSPGFVRFVTGGGGGHPADFNGDGTVNAADLTVWRSAFGTNANGDADNDGDSDGNDFLIWQRSLGATGASGSVAAVPEPSSLALAILVGGVLAGKRRRR